MTNVCVIGLGRIGLSLALLLAQAKHRVFGVDTNPQTLYKLRNNERMLENSFPEKAMLQQYFDKCFFVTSHLHEAMSESEVVFVAIGTGITDDGKPELSNLFSLMDQICYDPSEIRGKLFVLKSTLPVGTTRKIVAAMEQKTKMRCGKDFFVAFCPERVLGDKALIEMASLPKIIGGYDKTSCRKAARIYETIGGKIIPVECPEIAELIKLMDNAYRQTLFAFANDFALLAEQFGINAYELIRTANDSYQRNNIPLPSGGVSGYCLTKDPLYLEASFQDITLRRGFPSVWYSARKANDYMPLHMVDLLKQAICGKGKTLKGSNILVCGITYKENVDDIRCSHGLEIASRLRKEKANVFLWDPHVHEENLGYQMVNDPEEIVDKLDALVFTVKHGEFISLNDNSKINRIVRKMRTPIVVDGWGIFQKLDSDKRVQYVGVGYPTRRGR